MATVELTDANLTATIRDHDIVLVDFWAPWCGPCRMFGPIFERVSERHPDVVFGKLNTEDNLETARRFNIRAIPTLAVFRGHKLLWSQAGALTESALEQLVERTRTLDVKAVQDEVDGYRRA
jgi:thioredoxin